jgi:hypothetical protein
MMASRFSLYFCKYERIVTLIEQGRLPDGSDVTDRSIPCSDDDSVQLFLGRVQ